MTAADLDRWRALEHRFAVNGYDGDAALPDPLLVVAGRGDMAAVVVTAGHAVNHMRRDAVKDADRGTGGLALLVGEHLGCSVVVHGRQDGTDPNFDEVHRLKDAVTDMSPSMVIDLHGMRVPDGDSAGVEVDLGTGSGLVPERLVALLLARHELTVVTDDRFDAARPSTVAAHCQRRGIPAVQVELSASVRPPLGSDERMEALLTVLEESMRQAAAC